MSKILRIVSIASAKGTYGGPFDTASRQLNIATTLGFETTLLAGYLRGDRPTGSDNAHSRTRYYPVRRLGSGQGFSAIFSFSILVGLFKSIRESDVVHISIAREMIPMAALFLAKMLRRRIILQPHGMLTARSTSLHRLIDTVLKPLVANISKIIVLTSVEEQEIKSWLGRNYRARIVVLGNPVAPGIEPRKRDLGDNNVKEALFVARLHRRKRVDLFLGAAEIADSIPDWFDNYTVIGPDEGHLAMVSNAVGRLSNLRYEGAIDPESVTKRVQRCSVFVLTAEDEPWGNVLALSLASGIPVVVSRSAAMSSLIEKYSAGRVCPDGDPLSVAHAVHDLLTDSVLYGQASEGALALASSELDNSAQIQKLGEIYGNRPSTDSSVRATT